jgi:hypothetical protein
MADTHDHSHDSHNASHGDSHGHGDHGHGDHGHDDGHGHTAAGIIPEKSIQDAFLALVSVVSGIFLVILGFVWAQMPLPEVSTEPAAHHGSAE